MNFNTWMQFRHQVYRSFDHEADALFNLCDTLLSDPSARSLPELSQSPTFQRQWPSLYQALQRGRIDTSCLRHACVQALLAECT